MGGEISSLQCTLSSADINALVAANHKIFAPNEIKALWYHFMSISLKEPKISRKQFQGAMLFRDSALVDRIFRVFDKDDDDLISFNEYVSCLAILSNKASDEDKLKLSFQIYDFDGDGRISTKELTSLLSASLREHGLVISKSHIDEIVKVTMDTSGLSEPGFINLQEYTKMVSSEPLTLSHLSLNISSLIAKYSEIEGLKFETPRT